MKRFFLLSALAIFLNAGSALAEPLKIFVSILPQKYVVERIGGANVDVSVMVGPGRSPATYEPSPRQMAALDKAKVYFRIGVAFESIWMERIEANYPSLRVVDLRGGIALRTMKSHHHDDLAGHEEIADGAKDPHTWTSPPLVKIMAGHIMKVLSELDPASAPAYRANYEAFAQDLDDLDRDIRKTLAPLKNRRFLVFHPSWGYFADTYGLQQIPIEAEGKEPGAKTLARIIDEAKKENIHIIFVQQQFSKQLAENVGRAIDGKVVAVDPLAEDYLANMRHVTEVFASAMEKQ